MKDITLRKTKESNTLDEYLVYIPSIWYYTMSYNADSTQWICIYEWEEFNPDIRIYRECNEMPIWILRQVNLLLSE